MSNQTSPRSNDPEKRSRAATRLKLIESAPAVFAEHGIEGASVSDLCAAANFTRGAFYSNFETKTELAVAVFEHLARHLTETLDSQLDQWLDSGLDVETVVTRIIQGVTDRVSDSNQQAVRVELFLAAFRSPEVRRAVEPIRDLVHGAIEQALTRVAESQHLEFVVPPQEVARVMVASYSGVLTDHMAVGGGGGGARHIIPTMWLAFTRPA